MFKLLLVVPPCFTSRELDFEIGFPVHLALLGAAARSVGWLADYVDMTLEEKEGYDSFAALTSKLDDPAVRVIGISNHTVRTSVTTKIVAEHVKAVRPDVTVIVGGVNSTFMWQAILTECPAIDSVLRGYAQPGLREVLRRIASDLPMAGPGVVRRDLSDFVVNPLGKVRPEDFSTPPLSGFSVQRYLNWTRTYSLLTHTGCGFSCNFCTSVMPGPYQDREVHRPVDDVIAEMTQAINLGFERFFISDNVFTSGRDRCLSLCRAIRETLFPAKATWVCMTRVELVDAELLEEMSASGCTNVAFGVETAGARGWAHLQKGRYAEPTIRQAFRLTKEAGIDTTAYLMIGAPSQTYDSIEETIELLREIEPDYRVISFFQPFPGTPYWDNPERYGLSEIVPFDEWNFHEAPICRTAIFSKADLIHAAARMYLDRGPQRIDIECDALAVRADLSYLGEPPEAVREAIAACDGATAVSAILRLCTSRHGARGRLMVLYWLSAAIAHAALEVVPILSRKESRHEAIAFTDQ